MLKSMYIYFLVTNMERLKRTKLLIGQEKLNKLINSHVAIFGVGGVGGYVAEALARSGVGTLDLIDNDVVSESNINRQIIALTSTIGQAKVDVAKQRILDINPDATVNVFKTFYLPGNNDFDFAKYDYVVDAIDTVSGKIALIENANKCKTKIISAMGAGNKLDPTAFVVTDIYKTSFCPLARVMRRELKKRNIPSLKVVYSTEEAIKQENPEFSEGGKSIPGSNAIVPAVAGLLLANEVIKDLTEM